MPRRVCVEPGCPRITDRTRCVEHERAKDRARGSAVDRGYDRTHRALRADWLRRMKAGEVVHCWRCGQRINPDAFQLGHCDDDRTIYHGPENVGCNTATSGRRGVRCPHPSHN